MDFLAILKELLELAKTAFMLAGLLYVTGSIRVKDDPLARRAMCIKGIGFVAMFLLLNLVSRFYF